MSAALAVLSNISCLSDFTLPIRHVTLILHSEWYFVNCQIVHEISVHGYVPE